MKDPAVLIYYKDFLVSTQDFPAAVLGWYTRLLFHQADKGSLPSDLEELALLAGVKFSDFKEFKSCFKHTLKAQFQALEGTDRIHNPKMTKTVENRKSYSKRQGLRGLRGYYFKQTMKYFPGDLTSQNEFLDSLITEQFYQKSKDQRESIFKHTLEAIKVNVNAIEIEDVNEGKRERESERERGAPLPNGSHMARIKWEAASDPFQALSSESKQEDFRKTFTDNPRFADLDPGVEFWLEKWSLSVIGGEAVPGLWKTKSWTQLSALASRYLLSCSADPKNKKKASAPEVDLKQI